MAELRTQLGDAIRNWIHTDNLIESLSHQVSNARAIRAKHEADAIRLIKELKIENSTIKVSGATLHLTKRKVTSGLTWGYLDREITNWSKNTGIQIKSLIAWLQDHREITEVEGLKKDIKT